MRYIIEINSIVTLKVDILQFHLDMVGFLSYTVRYYMRRRQIIDTRASKKSIFF